MRPNFYLARALYIPAIVCIMVCLYMLSVHDYVNAAVIIMFGTMLAILGFLASI
jgi:hypothetical protein